jgi:hypothetical protein
MCERMEAAQALKQAACELSNACRIEILRKYDPVRFNMNPVEDLDRRLDELLKRLDQ